MSPLAAGDVRGLPAELVADLTDAPAIPRQGRVVKAGEVAQLLAEAEQAAALRSEQAMAARLTDAYEQGYAEGRAAAEAALHQAETQAVLRAADALGRLADESARLQAEDLDAAERAVLAAALELTRWVLRSEPTEASRTLLTRLTSAARTLATPAADTPVRTVVRVNAADADAVRAWARDGVDVVVDARLAPGEARLDRGEGTAILTFSAALRRAAEALGVGEESGSGGPA